MRGGTLRHWITVEQETIARDAFGGEIVEWAAVPGLERVPASFRSLRGDELYQAQSVNPRASAEYRVRYQRGLTDQIREDMRIAYDGMLYNITAVLPDMTRRRELVITVERGLLYREEQQ